MCFPNFILSMTPADGCDNGRSYFQGHNGRVDDVIPSLPNTYSTARNPRVVVYNAMQDSHHLRCHEPRPQLFLFVQEHLQTVATLRKQTRKLNAAPTSKAMKSRLLLGFAAAKNSCPPLLASFMRFSNGFLGPIRQRITIDHDSGHAAS